MSTPQSCTTSRCGRRSTSSPHSVDDLLSGAVTPDDYLANFDGTGVSIAGLNCNGNRLHPDPEGGPEDADDLRKAIRVAGLLGVDRLVAMSGLPHAHPGGQWPAWHVNTWDSGYLDSLDCQWNEVALPVMERDRHAGKAERCQGGDRKCWTRGYPNSVEREPDRSRGRHVVKQMAGGFGAGLCRCRTWP